VRGASAQYNNTDRVTYTSNQNDLMPTFLIPLCTALAVALVILPLIWFLSHRDLFQRFMPDQADKAARRRPYVFTQGGRWWTAATGVAFLFGVTFNTHSNGTFDDALLIVAGLVFILNGCALIGDYHGVTERLARWRVFGIVKDSETDYLRKAILYRAQIQLLGVVVTCVGVLAAGAGFDLLL
jgi:hypothetical protein